MINGGYQPSTTSFDDSFTFTLYQETGTTETSYDVGGRRHLRGWRSRPLVERPGAWRRDLAFHRRLPRHRDVLRAASVLPAAAPAGDRGAGGHCAARRPPSTFRRSISSRRSDGSTSCWPAARASSTSSSRSSSTSNTRKNSPTTPRRSRASIRSAPAARRRGSMPAWICSGCSTPTSASARWSGSRRPRWT